MLFVTLQEVYLSYSELTWKHFKFNLILVETWMVNLGLPSLLLLCARHSVWHKSEPRMFSALMNLCKKHFLCVSLNSMLPAGARCWRIRDHNNSQLIKAATLIIQKCTNIECGDPVKNNKCKILTKEWITEVLHSSSALISNGMKTYFSLSREIMCVYHVCPFN